MYFAVTFQQRYARDLHPIIPEVTHQSYWLIEADDEEAARMTARLLLGNDYSFMYPYDEEFYRTQIVPYALVQVFAPDELGQDIEPLHAITNTGCLIVINGGRQTFPCYKHKKRMR